VKTLQTEIALLKTHLPKGVCLSRLHWGGGTPTLLPEAEIRSLARAVFDAVPMAAGAEFSVEIDPNEIDAARLDALVASGMTRASIGVQDFDPEIQAIIGRKQSYDLTRRIADMIRDRGITSLNADILFGLPRQTRTRMTDSVQKLLSLAPDRVALYGYAHVPWMSRRQQMIPSDDLPSPQDRLTLFETATDLFTADGYDAIGIDHFALPTDSMARAARAGTLRRNFQGYTDDTAPVLVGLGASSISRFPQGFAQNVSGTADYTKSIRAGRLATYRGHVFVGDDKMRARIIEALLCDFHISRDEILRDFPINPPDLDALLSGVAAEFEDLLRCDATGLTVLPEGRPLARMVARSFDTYDQSKAKHSAAV
jgi:oxygen-independent coproporphyrinogen-3 oxidase